MWCRFETCQDSRAGCKPAPRLLRDDLEFFQVLVVLSQFIELRFQVQVFIRQLKPTGPSLDVGMDVGNAFDLCQIAAHGSGTAASGHLWQLERHQHDTFRQSFITGRRGCRRTARSRVARHRWRIALTATNGERQEQRTPTRSFHEPNLLKSVDRPAVAEDQPRAARFYDRPAEMTRCNLAIMGTTSPPLRTLGRAVSGHDLGGRRFAAGDGIGDANAGQVIAGEIQAGTVR